MSSKTRTLCNYFFFISLAFSFLFLIACTYQNNNTPVLYKINKESITKNTQGVVGGHRVNDELMTGKYLVGLFAPRFGNCTGVIIDKNLILTAAHCVPPQPETLTAIFAPDLMNASPDKMRSIVSARIFPQWTQRQTQEKDRGDLALLRFQGNLPVGYSPVYLLNSSQYLQDRSFTLLAGYGLHSGTDINSFPGLLREVFTVIGYKNYSQTEILLSQLDGKGTCVGDSGGPAFILINGIYYLWGITSSGDPQCRIYGIYTNILPFYNWIKQTASELNK